jgi:hypothetical protein
MQLLVSSFNPVAAGAGLMCRDTVSVRWDGTLYDCDFNQQLDINMVAVGAAPRGGSSGEGTGHSGHGQSGGLTVFDVRSLRELEGWGIAVDSHCYGCTAGAGSSCGGQAVAG